MLSRWFGTAQLDHRAVLRMVAPVCVSTVFNTLFFALTPLIVATAGIEAISAVSSVEFLNLVLVNIFVALATAGSVLVAQYRGGGSHDEVQRATAGTLWAAVLPAVGLGALLLALQGPVLHALLGAAGGQVVAYGRVYLIGSALSYPAAALVEAGSAALRGVARTTPALYLTVAMNGGFLLLATLLVRGVGLGVPGLAVALVVARFAAAGLALWLLRRDPVLGDTSWKFDSSMVRRVGVVGLPFVAEQLFFNSGKLLIQFFIVGLGIVQVTANTIAASLASISEVFSQALCIAIVPVVGQAIGAGRPDDARRIMRSFLWTAAVVPTILGGIMFIWFDELLALFHAPPQLKEELTVIFLLVTVARVLWSMSFLLPSGLRAAGDTTFTTTVATISMGVRVVLIWVVAVRLGFGVVGAWSVMAFEWGLRATAFGLRFRSARWERRALVPTPAPAVR